MNLGKKIVLLSYISVASASSAIITPAFPIIESSFSLTTGSLEWIVTLFLFGYMFGQLIYGPLANRYGTLSAIRIGFIINLIGIVFSLIAAYLHSYSFLLVSRLITSLGAAAGLCCTFTLVHELLSEEEAKKTLSYTTLSFTFGIGLSIFIGGLITEYIHWSGIFWALLIHGYFVLQTTWMFPETLKEKKDIHPKAIFESFSGAFTNRKLLVYSLFFGISSVYTYCYSTMAPLISHHFLKLNAAQYGIWSNLLMIGMLAGSITIAQIIKRYSPKKLLIVSLVMFGLGILSFILQNASGFKTLSWFFITASFLYFATSWVFPIASFLAMQGATDKASSSSCMSFINMFSAVVCVTAMGYLPLTHFTAMITILILFVAICISIYWINIRTITRLQPAEEKNNLLK